jgi:hypothetical protein
MITRRIQRSSSVEEDIARFLAKVRDWVLACARDQVFAYFSENGMWAHGCSARLVSAVARGHGRDTDAGMKTARLVPLLSAYGSTR